MPAPAAASKAASSAAQKGAGAANIASAVGDVGAVAISAISTINDVNKRRKFEQNFAQLTLDQQKGLELKLLDTNSQSERLKILGEYLTQLNSQRIANLANFYSDKEKSKRTNLLIIAGGVGILAIIATIIILKRR
jgi:hypothetical protein